MTEGTITTWEKKVGDRIEPGDILCQVETDKAVVAFESVEEGYLAGIVLGEGSNVPVGDLIGYMVEEPEELEAAKQAIASGANSASSPPAPAASTPPPSAPATEAAPAAPAQPTFDVDVQEILFPALSPTMTEGTIASWEKKVGDRIEAGDILAQVETDKAVVAFESVEEGYLAGISQGEGSTVLVGDLIGYMVEEAEELEAAKQSIEAGPSTSAPAAAAAPAAATEAAPAAPAVTFESFGVDVQEILFPALSPTMTEGTIASWEKKVGDRIEAGDILAQVETDKAVVAFESVEEGYLAGVTEKDGSTVEVGSLIGFMVEEEEELAAAVKAIEAGAGAPQAAAPAAAAPTAAATTAASPAAVPSGPTGGNGHITPAVYFALKTNNIDPASVVGTGRNGMLLKGDVLTAIANGSAKQLSAAETKSATPAAAAAAAAPTSEVSGGEGRRTYTDIPNTTMRKVIASRLSQSKSEVPHHYVTATCALDNLIATRKTLVALGTKVSVNDFIIKAASAALADVPEANVTYGANGPQISPSIDIAFAVATPTGLITPIIPNANQKGLGGISTAAKELAEKAKDNKLQPHEFMGGSFTISNLGMFGIAEFKAIINQPQAIILAVSGPSPIAKFNEEGELEAVTEMKASLSCDERCVDGATAAQFLEKFKGYIENPTQMLL